jgi:uroporphyrinogen-III decarboxylase
MTPRETELTAQLHECQAALAQALQENIRQAKVVVGDRLCLCGNMDCGLLQFGPPEKIRETTRQLVRDLGPQGGFVLGASNAVVPAVPLEHYRQMLAGRVEGQV